MAMGRRRFKRSFRNTATYYVLKVVALFACCVVGAHALNRFGPTKGWMQRLGERLRTARSQLASGRTKSPAKAVEKTEHSASALREATAGDESNQERPHAGGPAETPYSTSRQKVPSSPLEPLEATEPRTPEPSQKTRLELLYENLRSSYLDRLKEPPIGEPYKVKLRDGRYLSGTLLEARNGAIVLGMPHGKMILAIHAVHPSQYRRLFPARAAKLMALRELTSAARELAEIRREEDPRHSTRTAPAEETAPLPKETSASEPAREPTDQQMDPEDQESTTTASVQHQKPIRFQPEPRTSSTELKPVVRAFGGWLNYQHRRMGGKIADSAYAKEQGRNAVLYLVMDPLFLAQDYDVRFQTAEAIWQFWAFRCQAENVISTTDQAFVVMLQKDGRIVGGSKPETGEDVWVMNGTDLLSKEH
ncbi:MAG: hypothetical protein K9N51_04350 [Candidatus Pacebacteria bacterium]|nr:hypothetical protein [Candidatus Paceibacterota bacterium]